MRYYDFVLNTDSDQIKTNSKIKLYEHSSITIISQLNEYMVKSIRNETGFFAYREEEKSVFAVFSFDERKVSFEEAYDYISEMLYDAFLVRGVKADPSEITMYRYMDCFIEAKRRDYMNLPTGIVETSKLWIYHYYKNNLMDEFRFDFEERIIPERPVNENGIYDKGFIKELSNIETHENITGFSGNMVHYVISCRSVESASDMTGRLMQALFKANRVSSRRMEIISNLEPDIYKTTNHIEEIIENNYGGVVIFDLTEKFGRDPVDYVMASRYLERIVKKYRNHCLFVFTYNIDHSGFSYQLLPNLNKYVITVMLREGRGNRNNAVRYLRSFIESSEYARHADQAGEFMKLFPGDDFSQTDVINAYERFESWCINKNILKAYDYSIPDGFMLDRDKSAKSAYDKLYNLIGLENVKKQVERIITTNIVEKERKKRKGNTYQSGSMHMIFGGNPGSAKTTVAKLFAGIAKERGILKSGAFVERGGMDLDGLGCVTMIREAFTAANGGVLFIDEAYSLKSDTAVTVLIQEMENRRDDVIVILAGYSERMRDFLKINEGLKSRVPHWIDFPDYTSDELTDIFKFMIEERGFSVTDDAVQKARCIFEKARKTENFGNGRYVRNLIERSIQNQAVRLLGNGKEAGSIQKKTLFGIIKDDISNPDDGLKEERRMGFAC